MARPRKSGLDYFPFDVDFFNDEKIVAIAGEFGVKGEIAAVKLLCAIYRNGYFIEWNEMLLMKLLHQLPGLSSELISQIVMRLVKWGFFDKDLFDSASILTSRGIQKRYFDATKKRTSVNGDLPYILGFRGENSRLDVVSAEKTPANEDFSPKKVHKVKESKDNIKLSTTLPPACEKDFLKNFDSLAKNILEGGSEVWLESIKNKYHISDIREAFIKFRQYAIEMSLLDSIKDGKDFKKYFVWRIDEFLTDKNNEHNRNNRLGIKGGDSGKGYTIPACGLIKGKRE